MEVGSSTLHTRLVGTFGYMPPEYDLFCCIIALNYTKLTLTWNLAFGVNFLLSLQGYYISFSRDNYQQCFQLLSSRKHAFQLWFVCTGLDSLIPYIFCRYAQYGDVSPKIDVYAFGVVLYELISAKNAVLKTGETVAESKGLVALVSLDSRCSLSEPYLQTKHFKFTNLN